MRKNIKNGAIFPMPVLLISTYNDDDSVNVMNAAWCTMLDKNNVILNLSEKRKTIKNIQKRKGFTISIADSKHIKEIDYFGVVSGNNVEHKLDNTSLTYIKSFNVDAPIINEFPICMECVFTEYNDFGLIGKIVNTSVDESVMIGNKIDIDKLSAIAYDPYTNGYYKVSKRVGNAFKDGLNLK